MSFKTFTKNANLFISKNSPTILTAMGAGGLVGTVVLAVKATINSNTLYIDEIVRHHNLAEYVTSETSEFTQPTKMEVVKLCWKEYIPVVIMGSLSISCIIGANKVNLRRQAALASLYSVASGNLKDYQSKVKEIMGDKKHDKVMEEVDKQRLNDNPVSDDKVILTGHGDTLCYDVYSGRYFKQNIENLRRAENVINKNMVEENTACINDFYYEIGLDPIKLGEELGWTIMDGLIELRLGSQLTANNVPCVVVDWDTQPTYF